MASLFRSRPRTALCQCQRAFSTTSPRAISLQWEKNNAEALADTVPEYPHGPTRWYKQSRLGLYGGQRIRFGNNVGEKIEVKTRRSWHPNILTRKLFSKALDRHVQVRVSTRVLRTIDKLGGLDEYLLGEKEGRIKSLGESGWWLRWAIMQTPAVRKKFAEDKRRLGVPEAVVLEAEAEVAEAPAIIEEATEAESDAAELEGEALATDGAFQIEQTPGLPPLKFRVDRGKHIVLTPSGWRRTRPDPMHWVEPRIAKIQTKLEQSLLPRRMADFEAELSLQQEAATTRSQELERLYNAARDAVLEERAAATEEAKDESRKKRDAFEDFADRSFRLQEADEEGVPPQDDIFERGAIFSKVERAELIKATRKEYQREMRSYAEEEYARLRERIEDQKSARKASKRDQRALQRERTAELESVE